MRIKDITELFSGTKRLYKEGSTLIYQGEVPRSGHLITKGAVKVYTLQKSGDEQIAAFLGPGDFFPMSWLFNKTTSSPFYYETVEFCETTSILRTSIKEAMDASEQFREFIVDKLANDLDSMLMRVTALEQSRATEKILFTLYYLLYQFGEKKSSSENEYVINIKLTHATISSLVGLTRETTATELSNLKQKGVLTYSKKIYTVNKQILEKSIGEDGFSELVEAKNN